MSARNSAANKKARRKARLEAPLPEPATRAHGVCRTCTKRRVLWLPARLCEPCLQDEPMFQIMMESLNDR